MEVMKKHQNNIKNTKHIFVLQHRNLVLVSQHNFVLRHKFMFSCVFVCLAVFGLCLAVRLQPT